MLPRMVALALTASCFLTAAVRQIHLVERTDVPGYPYERIVAKVHFAIDPNNPSNRIIRDIHNVPKNADGLVEFSSDLYVLKPRDPATGNGTILLEVNNRGRKGLLTMFNFAAGSLDPKKEEDFGDGLLLKQGYTIVWVGWQPDVALHEELMRLFTPIAKVNGQTITGPVRAQWIVDTKQTTQSLGDRNTHIGYAAVNPGDPSMKLTVQDHADAPKRIVPRDQWKLNDPSHITMDAGFEPGKIYELIYNAQDPSIVGLGPAAIRDVISFLKYENAGTILLGDQSRYLKRAIGFGTSQSGRFLRTYLYYGFNQDEKNRRVFDGVWSHVAGGGRGSFNHRFAQPSRDGHPFLNMLYPTDIFPFTDDPQTDPATGLTDGLLVKAEAAKVTPKIFYTNGSYEYWGRAASLIHTSIDGKSDIGLSRNSRAYLLSGTQHGPGTFPPRKSGTQHLANPNDYRFIMRGLLTAMNGWLKDGTEPPPSQVPRVEKGQLVAPAAVQFPKLAGVQLPQRMQRAWRADYGPEFLSHGIVTYEPPKLGKAFPTLVPQVNIEGNEISGIRLPELQVPLGTYTGWNLRDAKIGAPTEFFNMVGSFFPLPRTKDERAKNHDPRLSIEERYASREVYLARISEAAKALAASGYILPQDVPALEQRASKQWDSLAATR
ncbi:MAG TPA: alpha/beta hydrolase domain-containing protein [Bryobacteraceae bacterium]|nr:alpha/beta hydrolase domain-containing protein [Bryobacteraceae bacterium]